MNTFKYKKVPHHCSVVNVLDIACLAANKDFILQRMECKSVNEKLKCVFSNKIVYVACICSANHCWELYREEIIWSLWLMLETVIGLLLNKFIALPLTYITHTKNVLKIYWGPRRTHKWRMKQIDS